MFRLANAIFDIQFKIGQKRLDLGIEQYTPNQPKILRSIVISK